MTDADRSAPAVALSNSADEWRHAWCCGCGFHYVQRPDGTAVRRCRWCSSSAISDTEPAGPICSVRDRAEWIAFLAVFFAAAVAAVVGLTYGAVALYGWLAGN